MTSATFSTHRHGAGAKTALTVLAVLLLVVFGLFMLTSDKITSGAAQLADGLETAHAGSGDLAAGAVTLADGNAQLADGAASAAAGAAKLSDGAGSAADGATRLAAGADSLAAGAQSAASGALSVSSGSTKVASGANSVAAGVDSAIDGVAQLRAGAIALRDGVLSTQPGGLIRSISDIGLIVDGVGSSTGTLAGVAAGSRTEAQNLQAYISANLAVGEPLTADELTALLTAAGTWNAQANALNTNLLGLQNAISGTAPIAPSTTPTLKQAMGALSAGVTNLATTKIDGANGLVGGLDTFRTKLLPLQQGAASLAAGASDLNAGASKLTTGTQNLAAGSTTLAENAGALASGVGALASGASELADGTAALSEGAASASDGSTQLSDGASTLDAGTAQLADGATQLHSGASSMTFGSLLPWVLVIGGVLVVLLGLWIVHRVRSRSAA
ncbi:YhgE/Pip domain-containing protein [Protaetiibacter intestinalis]|uniref:Methyl-accepting chemotaxis protein n=1 Tax=Protaetiibacter intestinalis TaxID=2419774 RepID=A0A387B7Z7_9MICO|nr:hypothetical protein [Protaetiibacter intestinalis]AYF97931.1 hypothetical protein D7I47_06435 [Protaetiibacter intestinalis]